MNKICNLILATFTLIEVPSMGEATPTCVCDSSRAQHFARKSKTVKWAFALTTYWCAIRLNGS